MAEKKKIRPTIEEMKTGDKVIFPIEHTLTVRVTSCELGLIHGRKYKTKTNRDARTITVIRIE